MRVARPVRDAVGRRLQAIVDARVAERLVGVEERIRHAALREHQVFGPAERLSISATAEVNDALFNTVSGSISVGDQAFFGHGVAVLTGTHDIERFGAERRAAIPGDGRDVVIGPGAWIASRATVLGPCVVGKDAVVCAGAVVTEDVPARTVVAGVPARPVRTLDPLE